MSEHGHGYVTPRPDGSKTDCGGPAVCAVCNIEAAADWPKLLTKLTEARAVLKMVEWEGGAGNCPVCAQFEPTARAVALKHDHIGHAPDCRLAKAIGP